MRPIARILPLVGPAHLDRPFDYKVDSELDEVAQPGVRVRVRFHGRLVDGYLLERRADTDHVGKLGWLERVVSAEQVLTPTLLALCEAVAARYGGTLGDVLRLAIPPRHAATEAAVADRGEAELKTVAAPAHSSLTRYVRGADFLSQLQTGGRPRVAWQPLLDTDPFAALADMAQATVAGGRTALLIVPDQRDLDRLTAACQPIFGANLVSLAAGLGPSARYRRWLLALRGHASVVVGTRSAGFTPLPNVGLVAVWDDGDESLSEPRAPYPHAREVAVLRSHSERSALVLGSWARTVEAQALVGSGWLGELAADRAVARAAAPRVEALSDAAALVSNDPHASTARIPDLAYRAAATALAADLPVLISVPHAGYEPALACTRCQHPVRCRHCHGPVAANAAGELSCRWCGRSMAQFRCSECGNTRWRAARVGAERTAEEFGRAFGSVPVAMSGGGRPLAEVPGGRRIVVATPGVEPTADGGYGAALILDTWRQLGRMDLRADEEAVRRWFALTSLVRPAAAGGHVVIVADAELSPVRTVIRGDSVAFADAELAARDALGFPPAVAMAAIDGPFVAVRDYLDRLELAEVEILGPVPLPPGVRPPAGSRDDADLVRSLLRVPRARGRELAHAVRLASVARSTVRPTRGVENDPLLAPIRVQVDPPTVG